jgi:CelD/BcsL family acetyltransferase involved in cellulose biosynthesis
MIAVDPQIDRSAALQWDIIDSMVPNEVVAKLRAAWDDFEIRSPFASPASLAALCGMAREAGNRPLLAIGMSHENRVAAVWPLQVDRKRRLRFLQDEGSDHCIVLAQPSLTESECAAGLLAAMGQTNDSGLFFQRVLPAGITLGATRRAIAELGWPMKSFTATPCPLMSVEGGADAGERFKALILSGNKRLKDYQNKLQKQEEFVFEADEHDSSIKEWADEFCDMHDWRWSLSTTPSMYARPAARNDLLSKLRAWQEDGVLVRFAIRLKTGRAAMVVGLKCGDRLVYHHTAANPAYDKLHAGNVLIRMIALWMADRGYRTLDFGVGDEEYKFRFANTDEKLYRIYAAPSRLTGNFVRGLIDERIRASAKLQGSWDRVVNKGLRGRWAARVRSSRIRLGVIRNVYVRAPMRQRVGLLRDRLLTQRETFYHACGGGEIDQGVRPLTMPEICAIQSREVGLFDHTRKSFHQLRFDGAVAYGIVEHEQVLQISWLKAAEPSDIPPQLATSGKKFWCISQCLTSRAARGRGLYPRVLKAILALLPSDDTALIYTHTWNVPSQKGILKAGFAPIAMSLRRRGESTRQFVPLVSKE